FDPHLRVAPAVLLVLLLVLAGARAARRRGIGFADIDAAGERHPAIDHRDLAVVAVVHGLDLLDGVEFAHRDAGIAQPLKIAFWRADRADAVVHDMHLDAALYFLCEQRREPLADLAAVED